MAMLKEARIADVAFAAMKWKKARTEFLALPSGSPDTRGHLDRLAEGEDRLSKSVVALENYLAGNSAS